MPQGSLLAWLNKPVHVIEPAQPTVPVADLSSSTTNTPPPALSPPPQEPHPNPDPRSKPAGLSPLPPNVSLEKCTKIRLPKLKRLLGLLLPIPYTDSFYKETISDATINDLTLLAFWTDSRAMTGEESRLVGAIRCRLLSDSALSTANGTGPNPSTSPDATDEGTREQMLYISTLAVLAPYRRHGIGGALIDAVAARAADAYGVRAVGAHVWEADPAAREWYARRGFRELRRVEGYYRRLKPAGAVVVRREVAMVGE